MIKQFGILYQLLRIRLARVKAYYYDAKPGIETRGHFPAGEDSSLNQDMYGYLPAFYGKIEKMVDFLKLTENDIFVDLGCGAGRVVFKVALENLKKVIGLELDKNLIDIARRNPNNLKKSNTAIELIHTDAATYKITEENIFFLFNPFGHKTLQQVVLNIKQSLVAYPRKVRIMYYAPAHRELLYNQDWLFLEANIENNDCLVWSNR